MSNIIILGRVPSKKNSRITTRTGRSFPSAKYTEWHKDTSWQLKACGGACRAFKEGFKGEITMKFWLPDNRKTDLDNKSSSLLDLFVDNGLLEDDSWQFVRKITLEAMGVDKKNPRVEIFNYTE